ncbi:uncharacterized protein LOC122277491 [Carya illinoinensis]|uniref:uncharacterized protein LOC122277491 n=1 Tax=Carya illinoinensis TaxID=32201 RepID=UPI001C7269BF|nr:uncharacterized protein LOC122277491 [Carya illinoinensis]
MDYLLSHNLMLNVFSCSEARMASSHSSSVVNDSQIESPTCWCGLKTTLNMSHMKKNPRRRFFACPNYNTGNVMCEFFVWADILYLLEENFRARKNKASKMWDDVLHREYDIRKREDKVRKIVKNLKKEKRKLLFLYWVMTFVIVFAWFG